MSKIRLFTIIRKTVARSWDFKETLLLVLVLVLIGQQGSITRIWAKKGTRPRAVRMPAVLATGSISPSALSLVGHTAPKIVSGPVDYLNHDFRYFINFTEYKQCMNNQVNLKF
jgi:hypothetical protein